MEIIGSEEWCHFDELGIPAVKARVDSGAKTSSLQATDIQTFKFQNETWARFEIYPLQDNRSISVKCQARVVDRRTIKSSMGIAEERLVIRTPVRIGEQTFDIECTLAQRESMEYRMLLGREAMIGRYMVDPSRALELGDIPEEELMQMYKAFMRKKSGLRIALLASNRNLYSNQRIMEAAKARGHEIVFLNVDLVYMKLDAQTPEIRYRGGNNLTDIDAVIPRIKPSVTFYACALLRQFDALGVYCQNSAEAIANSRDKLYASQLFSRHDIHIPTTGFAKSPVDTKDLISMVNGAPLVIKLLESTQGMGVVMAETGSAAESVINAFKSLQANILVQEFIKEANGQDIRCFVVNGKVVASMQRQAAKGEFRSNVHRGGKASQIRITAEERKLAVKAAKILNLEVAGVDIIRSNKGPLLLEVNSSPGLEAIENATGKDIANMMIDGLEKRINYKSEYPEGSKIQEPSNGGNGNGENGSDS